LPEIAQRLGYTLDEFLQTTTYWHSRGLISFHPRKEWEQPMKPEAWVGDHGQAGKVLQGARAFNHGDVRRSSGMIANQVRRAV
jgi:hypothetical protein